MIIPNARLDSTDVSLHYDELDSFYRQIWGEHVHHGLWVTGTESTETAVAQLVDVVAAEAEIKGGDDVLDVGSGYGAAARQIVLDYGAHVTAMTNSATQHEYARTKTIRSNNPTYVLGDWMHNGLPDGSFDAVYAIECTSHMDDVKQFMREALRVLRPGGKLVICAWTAAERPTPRQARYLLEPICREGRLAHLSTATEYVDAIEKAGAVVRDFHDLSSNTKRTWSVAIRRTLRLLVTQPRFHRYLLDARSSQRIFLLTMVRIWWAYRLGALRYCMIKAYRPAFGEGASPARGPRPANLT